MVSSLAFIFLVGLCFAALCEKIHLPRILGMLLTGILLGPCVLNLLDPGILGVAPDLRKIALVIILLKAGLSLDLADLKRVGRPAVLMSFLPACFEILGFLIIAPPVFGISLVEAAVMGSVLAAVSPAVIVPKMVGLMEKGYGKENSIPQMILAGASMDDVFVIVLFTAFTGLAQGQAVSPVQLLEIPVSIGAGIGVGVLVGWGLASFFESRYIRRRHIRNSTKTVILLGTAFFLVTLEEWAKGTVPLSGLLAVMTMAIVLRGKSVEAVSKRLSEKFSKLWIGAELVLFVLVGAAVDLQYAAAAGFSAVVVLFLALLFRCAGVFCCMAATKIPLRERLFCMIAYLPKATVQAAIGSVPLAMGLPCGKLVLTVAVTAIMVTAPLGAFGIDHSYRRLLRKSGRESEKQ